MILLLLVLGSAVGMHAQVTSGPCPVVIGVGRRGVLYELNVSNKGTVRRELPTLRTVIVNGCYNDNRPSKVTSVTLMVAPSTTQGKLAQVYTMLAQVGWPKGRVQQMSWSNSPR